MPITNRISSEDDAAGGTEVESEDVVSDGEAHRLRTYPNSTLHRRRTHVPNSSADHGNDHDRRRKGCPERRRSKEVEGDDMTRSGYTTDKRRMEGSERKPPKGQKFDVVGVGT